MDEELLRAATKIVAVALATGVIEYFLESVDNRTTEFGELIKRAKQSTCRLSNMDDLDMYDCVTSVRSILSRDFSEEPSVRNIPNSASNQIAIDSGNANGSLGVRSSTCNVV